MNVTTPTGVSDLVAASLNRLGRNPEYLLHHLIEVQQHCSYVQDEAVAARAAALDVTRTQVRAAVRFYAFLHETPRGSFDILVRDNVTDRMLGNGRLLALLCERLGVRPGVPRAWCGAPGRDLLSPPGEQAGAKPLAAAGRSWPESAPPGGGRGRKSR